MTIEKIINELEFIYKDDKVSAKITEDEIMKSYYKGKMTGIKIALNWLKYIKNKTEV